MNNIFKNTYNLYKFTNTNIYFIAHQSIPFTKFPNQNFTLEDQSECESLNHAQQQFSSFNPLILN